MRRAREELHRCRVCPRDCDVNRQEDVYAFCRTGLAYRGLNVRHLAMQGGLDETEAKLRAARDTARRLGLTRLDERRPHPLLRRRAAAIERPPACC